MVNPARAGMIPAFYVRLDTTCGKPRASGDDPAFKDLGISIPP